MKTFLARAVASAAVAAACGSADLTPAQAGEGSTVTVSGWGAGASLLDPLFDDYGYGHSGFSGRHDFAGSPGVAVDNVWWCDWGTGWRPAWLDLHRDASSLWTSTDIGDPPGALRVAGWGQTRGDNGTRWNAMVGIVERSDDPLNEGFTIGTRHGVEQRHEPTPFVRFDRLGRLKEEELRARERWFEAERELEALRHSRYENDWGYWGNLHAKMVGHGARAFGTAATVAVVAPQAAVPAGAASIMYEAFTFAVGLHEDTTAYRNERLRIANEQRAQEARRRAAEEAARQAADEAGRVLRDAGAVINDAPEEAIEAAGRVS